MPFRPPSRRAAAVSALLLAVCALAAAWTGCDAPTTIELAEVDRPQDLEQLDDTVREQFEEAWSALRGSADGEPAARGAAWGALGRWFDIYSYADSAARCYANAQRLSPDEPRWPHYLGRLAEDAGTLDMAREHFRRAAELAPTAIEPRVRLADLTLREQDLDRAEAIYREVLELDAASPGGRFGLARVALLRGDPAAALALLEALAEEQPEAIEVRYSMATALRSLGENEAAAEQLARIPENNLDQISLSRDAPWDLELRQLDRGARNLTRRGVRAFRRGEHRKAATLLGQAVQADPDGPEKRINYALTLVGLGRPAQARDELLTALDLAEPGSESAAKAHLELGRLYRARRPAEARRHFEAALAIDPRSVPPHVELGRLEQSQGRLDAALAHYAEARVLDPGIADVRFWHAALLIALGRHDEARAALEEDLRAVGEDRALRLLLARLLSAAPDAALRDARHARRLLDATSTGASTAAPDVFQAETAAMTAAGEGRFTEALAWQEAAIATLSDLGAREALHIAHRRRELYRLGEACRNPWEAREPRITRAVIAP